jgi:GWxTD domain-containing protein
MQFWRCAALLCALSCFELAAATKVPLPAKYKKWLTEDVGYIITDEEKKDFLALSTDEQRERFVADFWSIRNPRRDSSGFNPAKEEHYRRLAYANETFGRKSNTPGWMTDMGRAYVLFGKPTSRQPFTGYGQIYPLELWFYSSQTSDPSLPPFFYLLFYMPEDIGEYKFYKPSFDGPLKLVRGSRFNSNADVYRFLVPLGGDLAHAAFSLIPNDPIDTQEYKPDMSSDMLIARIQNLANDSYNVHRIRELRSLRETVRSYLINEDNVPLNSKVIALTDPSGESWLDYGIAVDSPTLGIVDQKAATLTLSTRYRLLTEAGNLIVEDGEERAYAGFVGNPPSFQPFMLANRIPITPGHFVLELSIVNPSTGKRFSQSQKIVVPGRSEMSLAGPLLVGSGERVEKPDSSRAFQYFGVQFHPTPGSEFAEGTNVRALFEIRQPPEHITDLQAEYILASIHDRSSRQTITDQALATEFKNGALLKAKTVPLNGLPIGDYRLVINLRSPGDPKVLASSNVGLKIATGGAIPVLYFAENSRRTSVPAVADYIRGLEYMAAGERELAMNYFTRAVPSERPNPFAAQYLVQLYFQGNQFARIKALYTRLGDEPFKNSPESLAEIVLSFLKTGEPAQAEEVLKTAQRRFPNNAPLTAVAAVLKQKPRNP